MVCWAEIHAGYRVGFVHEVDDLLVGVAIVSAFVRSNVSVEIGACAASAALALQLQSHGCVAARVGCGSFVNRCWIVILTSHGHHWSSGQHRCCLVLNRERQCDRALIQAIVSGRECDIHCTSGSTIITQIAVFVIVTPSHRSTIVSGSRTALGTQEVGQLVGVSCSVTFSVVVQSTRDLRCCLVFHPNGLGMRNHVARAVCGCPCTVHPVSTGALDVILRRLALVCHGGRSVVSLAVVAGCNGRHFWKTSCTIHRLVFRSIDPCWIRCVVA